MSHVFARAELSEFHRQLALFADLLSRIDDRALWTPCAGGSNSPGTLARHLAGNVSHHVGAGLLRNGFRREREAEFRAPPCPRESLLEGLSRARTLLEEADRESGKFDWTSPWTTPDGLKFESLSIHILRLATHAAYHLGQCSAATRTP
jgi:hypothetical protein